MNKEVSRLIPPEELADEYISRTIHGVWDLDVLAYAARERQNVMLYGPTGSAKTTFVRAYAARERLPFVSTPCNGAIEPSQMFGRLQPTETAGVLKWQDGEVTMLARHGGVWLVDECNFAPQSVMASLHSLTDARRQLTLLDHNGEVINAHRNFQVIGAYNPRYKGTRPLNEAFLNRFAINIEFGYLREVEEVLIDRAPVLVDVAEMLRRAYDAGDLVTPVSTNRIMEFEDFGFDLGYVWARNNFLAAFQPEERDAVRQVLDLKQDELVRAFQVEDITPDYTDDFDDLEED